MREGELSQKAISTPSQDSRLGPRTHTLQVVQNKEDKGDSEGDKLQRKRDKQNKEWGRGSGESAMVPCEEPRQAFQPE